MLHISIIRKVQIKIAMSYHLIPIKIPVSKNKTKQNKNRIISVAEDAEK